jgi:hypothetical protein
VEEEEDDGDRLAMMINTRNKQLDQMEKQENMLEIEPNFLLSRKSTRLMFESSLGGSRMSVQDKN